MKLNYPISFIGAIIMLMTAVQVWYTNIDIGITESFGMMLGYVLWCSELGMECVDVILER